MGRKAEILLEYQNYIEAPPAAPQQMYAQSCSNDGVTIDAWRTTWLKNIRDNKKRFGSFKENSIGKFFGKYKYQPVILAGAGPSLKVNAEQLKNRGEIPLISCLHNFHYLEDLGAGADIYVSLDAGEVTVEEVAEGGSKSPEEYWELTRGKVLFAYIGSSPRLLEKWQGEIYFFNAPLPDAALGEEIHAIEPFGCWVSNGGNVLGACMYIAKAFLGCTVMAFVGADFSFSYDKKFHSWNSKYDAKLGYVLKAVDVYGNKVLTWQSYHNFKTWFDYIAQQVDGIWINCTEGGTFGAYAEGNIMAVKQMELARFIRMFHISDELKDQAETPETAERKILF
jgi:hypothetical protein